MSNFEIGRAFGELEARVRVLESRVCCDVKNKAGFAGVFGARVLNQTGKTITCWTGEPKPSTNNKNLFEVAANQLSPSDVDCDHVQAPSGQWYKCGEDVTGVRIVVVEPSGDVRNAECKTNSYNQDCAPLTSFVDELVVVASDRVTRAKSLLAEGNSYEKGCSGFICDVLQIKWENANSLMGSDAKYVGKDNSYSGLIAGDIVGWKVAGGSGHVAIYVGEAGIKLIDVKAENSKPRKIVNGYGDQSVYKSSR